ncbi:hypothetical protein AGMMS49953_06430 [Endomicrobiia bacterium]|nr:hypothetical protein AGMMS49953_06430 [Endomicrobiia bacterium]
MSLKDLNDIAPAKAFYFDYEIEALKKKGLALGGSMDNAIVIALDGVQNEGLLRYNNEFVRHKILDFDRRYIFGGKTYKS